ncbi:MAG: DUF2975 domain-containing protein [Ignavibacteria bacterium]
MKKVKLISSILFYPARLLAIAYILVTLYSALSIITEWSYILFDVGKSFSVCYPFTETKFMNGENSWGYKIFNFLIPLGFYGLFFLLLSNVFNAFRQPKLFTEYGVKQLKWFCIINIFILPVNTILADNFSDKIEEGLIVVAVIHFILGIFSYFLAAIFSQGVNLQNEQDLYI